MLADAITSYYAPLRGPLSRGVGIEYTTDNAVTIVARRAAWLRKSMVGSC